MSKTERVKVSLSNGIAEVVLNRPEKLNAWDLAMFDELTAAGERLRAVEGLRAVIIWGEGRAFSAGLDLALFGEGSEALATLRDALKETPVSRGGNRFQRPCTIWSALEVPVIAALHGVCYGAGLQLALGADLRIAAPTAKLSIMEIKWGLIPDMGAFRVLPRLMPADRALALILTAEVINGVKAQAIGLVTRTADDPLNAARALARAFAEKNPDAVRAIKTLVRAAWPGGEAQGEAALALEADLQANILLSANQQEAVRAALEGRAPQFSPSPATG